MVYQLATTMQLNGWVKNDSDGVQICFNASAPIADSFFEKLKEQAPAQSKIISATLVKVKNSPFTDFRIIIDETNRKGRQVLITPDTALCTTCKSELDDPVNRRYRYPFITCTQCGPRYSIVTSLPYDRSHTAMQPFQMCNTCKKEYDHAADRRFYSQTNSCAECGIELRLYRDESTALPYAPEAILLQIKKYLGEGKIIALKGVGGYLLLCDANKSETIELLRSRKHRLAKPFAILYKSLPSVAADFKLNEQEKILLESDAAPIVLLQPKPAALDHLSAKTIAPGLHRLGIMLPSGPLLHVVANDFGKPLVATSANISGSPIIHKDELALTILSDIADYVVSYNREIIVPQDDSVATISSHSKHPIILRRARGFAPSYISYQPKNKKTILTTGALLKSSFALSINGNVFVSQFLGSTESYESQQMYKDTLHHLLTVYAAKPDLIITDLHPGYFSHQYAIELAEKYGTKLMFIQHHEAHFAAVLAENNLISSTQPVLGVVWDGAGLGSDGNIWGGEFFKYQDNEMLRCYHFDYFPVIAGDKMAREPRISALCATHESWPPSDKLKEKFSAAEWHNYQALLDTTTLSSSSAGRLFDAVASLLNLCDKQSYEGQAAMYLQALAEDYVAVNGFVMEESYFREGAHYYRIPTASLMQAIIIDIKKGRKKDYIAAKFHYSLVCLVDIVAKNIQVEKICFSGGVFQNSLLVDWIQAACSETYELYFHKNVSPNDENISFGQLVYVDNEIRTSQNMIQFETKMEETAEFHNTVAINKS